MGAASYFIVHPAVYEVETAVPGSVCPLGKSGSTLPVGIRLGRYDALQAIFLGTAAAEGIPALFCGCDKCREAREAGGKNIRARQALFLPPDILIDLGPDIMASVLRFGLDFTNVSTVLVTHSHSDHITPENLHFAHDPFAHKRPAPLSVYGNDHVRKYIQHVAGGNIPNVTVHPAYPYEPIAIPGGQAIPIRSHHHREEHTLNYIVTKEDRTFLYACDTGYYDEETWEFLKNIRLDAAIFECTYGANVRAEAHGPGHLDLKDVVAFRDRLRDQGTLKPEAPVWITHFSHNGILPFEEFEALARERGLNLAYDGLRLDI